MSKRTTSISISYEEIDDAIWDAVVDYIHDLHGDQGQIQVAQNLDSWVYIPTRYANACTDKKEEKDE